MTNKNIQVLLLSLIVLLLTSSGGAAFSAPAASFTVTPNNGLAPLTVDFRDTSTGMTNSTYTWNFGDGTTSTTHNPKHTYNAVGTYTVLFTVRCDNGVFGKISYTATKTVTVYGDVVAGFTATPESGKVPLTVQFIDASTGATDYLWDFGDNVIVSGEKNPTHEYKEAGVYTVTLKASNPYKSNTVSKVIIVTPKIKPIAGFTSDKETGFAPLDIQFTDASTDAVSYLWDFGDGATSTDKNPAHKFEKDGLFAVKLTVTSEDGLTDEFTKNIVIIKAPVIPVADFTFTPETGYAPLKVQFTDASVNGESFDWDYNSDGTPEFTGQNPPEYTFDVAGTHTVTLTVTSPDGLTDKISKDIVVSEPVIPEAAFTYDPVTGNAPQEIQFTDASKDAVSYAWEFINAGDNSVLGTSNDPSPRFTFTTEGNYKAILTVTSVSGNTHSKSADIVITKAKIQPNALFYFDTDHGDAPLTVHFTDGSTDAAKYLWDFGDGTTSEEKNPAHTFAKGTYTVTLTVFSVDDLSSTATPVFITASEPIVPGIADFEFTPVAGDAPVTIVFTDKSTGTGISAWSWDFGDGATSTEQNPSHEYTADGAYNVKLIITSADGSHEVTKPITITKKQITPVAEFEFIPTTGDTPLEVQFTDKSTGAATYAWDFGGKGSSADANPKFTFEEAGSYDVVLTVTSETGQTATATHTIVVTKAVDPVAPVVAGFTSTVDLRTVIFTDASTGEPAGYLWDFGDGATSTEKNPVHVYASAGNYVVKLTVSKEGTEDNTKEETVTALPDPVITQPTVAAAANITTGNAKLPVAFTSDITGIVDSYSWDFGDGTTSIEENPVHVFQKAGTYQVKLTVSNENGESATSEPITITVKAPVVKPVASFYANRTSGSAPLSLKFSDKSTNTPTKWIWNFGDGTTSSTQNPTHTYAKAGKYTVTLTASNAAGSSVITRTNYITVSAPLKAPIAAFSVSPTSGYAPLKVAFTDKSTGSPTSWRWSFGDATYSTERNPVHTYSKAGKYTVSLTATNKAGSNTVTKSSFIVVNALKAPIAAFSASPTSGKQPLKIQFTDKSTGSPTSWRWSFGDATYSTGKSPSHTYSKAGKYTVSLTTKNAAGSNTKTMSGYIIVRK